MLCHLFLLLSLAGAVVPVATGLLSPFTLFLFPAYFVGLNLIYLIFLLLFSLVLPGRPPKKGDARQCRALLHVSLGWLMTLFHAKVRLSGREKLPARPCVLVSNHRSNFDPMVLLYALPERKLAFISKDANMRLPIAGKFAARCGFLGIERTHPLQSLRTVNRAAQMVKNEGYDFSIYPEGTRSRDLSLLSFKEGAFIAAKKAGAPIVVLSTEGTEKILRCFSLGRVPVSLRILAVIPEEKVAELSPAELARLAREQIAGQLEQTAE